MRADVAQCRMSSFATVEDLNIIEQAGFGLRVRQILLTIDLLLFERGKEALYWGIVPAVAATAHAAGDVPFLQPPLIAMHGILAAPVAVGEQ